MLFQPKTELTALSSPAKIATMKQYPDWFYENNTLASTVFLNADGIKAIQ